MTKITNLTRALVLAVILLMLIACQGRGPDLRGLAAEKLAEVAEKMAEVTPGPLPDRNNTVMPHVFVGSVEINGSTAADGVEVTVWVPKYDAPIGNGIVANGKYNLMAHAHGTGSFDGTTLIFKINGELSGDTTNWESGQASVIDLSID